MRDPTILEKIRAARRDGMTRCMARLQENATRAADNLDELQRTAESEAVRLAASKANLEFAFRSTEIIDVLERLAAVEQKLKSPDWRSHDTEPSNPETRGNRRVNGHAE